MPQPHWNSYHCSDILCCFHTSPLSSVWFLLPEMPFPLPDHPSFHHLLTHTVSLFPLAPLFILQPWIKCHLLPEALGSSLHNFLLQNLSHCFVNTIFRVFPTRFWEPERKTLIHHWIFFCTWNKASTAYACLTYTNQKTPQPRQDIHKKIKQKRQ